MRATLVSIALIATFGIGAAAQADDTPPPRKPGLWESKSKTDLGDTTVRQCVDEKTDQLAKAAFGGAMTCSKQSIVKTADGYVTDNDCKMGTISAKGKGLISGDFSSKLHIETDIVMTGLPGQKDPVTRKTVIDTAWVGPCAAGQSPGDIIMPDGKIVKMPGTH